ncbi:MAG: 16S rRNA (cytosine967-C5)-methyltransferase [Oleiphilaceae bacterium]|jgi:16S rRNA (cytosine967-C5)-methyltransferase
MKEHRLSNLNGSRPSKQENIRAIACQVVHNVVTQGQSLNTLLPKASELVAEKDSALLQELVFGTCRWFYHLEAQHNQFLEKPLHKNDKIAETLLKVGIYQLQYTRIPNHAALNETVSAAETLGIRKLKGLINAILRKINATEKTSPLEAAITSHPRWMQEKLKYNWPNEWESILQQNNQHPPMTLRVNKQHLSRDSYLKKLSDANIEAKACPFAANGISITPPCNVMNLPHFEDGFVSVQDEAAQLCCSLLDLSPNLSVLDACAAPGGKTCAMLETEPSLTMLALDSDAKRSERITENLERLNLSAQLKTANAEQVNTWWNGEAFDRILLDAPCSATGVIRRHPDIKLLRKEDDIKNLAILQLKLLVSLWPTLKQGGTLLYATCSIFSQENNRIIERFLKSEPTAEIVPIEANWGTDTGFGRQLFPQQEGHDGFFYARLTKTGTSI